MNYHHGMSFLSVLLALLIEQARPLGEANAIHQWIRNGVRWVVRNADTGKPEHAWLAWSSAVLLPALLTGAIHWLLVWSIGWLAAMVWSVLILYITLGFRQFSHHFTDVRDALLAADDESARQKLAAWMRVDVSHIPRHDMVGAVIAHSVLHAHRHIFGVLGWYSVLAILGGGPAGAVLYRLSEYFMRYATRPINPLNTPISTALQSIVQWTWYAMDWVPVRLTALGFAFAGSFEEAMDVWRLHTLQSPRDNDGVVLAATAGAINIQLGNLHSPHNAVPPQLVHLRSVAGLVWRTVVMWMVFLALVSLARLLG